MTGLEDFILLESATCVACLKVLTKMKKQFNRTFMTSIVMVWGVLKSSGNFASKSVTVQHAVSAFNLILLYF